MDRVAADSYVYAKASGIYSRSFIGKRVSGLFQAKRVRDLWSLLFEDEVPLVPEGLLALYLERRAEERGVNDFISLLSAYDKPDLLSRTLLSFYDYNNLKAAASAVSVGAEEPPFMVDIKQFSILDRKQWPDIQAMTKNSPLAWFDRVPELEEQVVWETRLDHEYYTAVWNAFLSLSTKDRASTETIIQEEIILQNIVWAMRLTSYYHMDPEQIIPMLACINEKEPTREKLCGPALYVLTRSFDTHTDWDGWKYSWLLNPHEEGFPWELDPRWAQLEGDKFLYRTAMTSFHQNPFTVGVLVSFLKIKQLEDQMIRIAAEGLRLGANETELNEYVGDIFHA
ncbi:MAG TPA: V-type ATPase subunit [Treponema sp.]|nr:V-type ATPase subunit [Treponema sp.]